MSGYVASARIVAASPHVVDRRPIDRTVDWRSPELSAVVLDGGTAVARGRPSRVSIGERWSRIHDRWDQLTFFVTDPQSWR